MHRSIPLYFIIAVMLHCAMVIDSLAQPAGYKSLENPTEFKSRFTEEGKKTISISSNFTQEKNLALLEEKITSQGKFWYRKENKVRLEYQKPFQYLMILNGDQMIVRDEQKENRVSTHSNKLFQQINQIIIGCVNGSILTSKDFTSEIYQDEKSYLLVLTPTAKALKEFFQNIQVNVNKKDWTVFMITMTEPGGDNTIMKFTDHVLNANLNDSLFNP